MAQVDASIPLSGIPPQIMNPGQVLSLQANLEDMQQRKEERPYRLAELQTKKEMNALSLQDMQQKIKKSQAFLSMTQQPGMLDQNGVPTAQGVQAASRIDPEIGMAWGELRTKSIKEQTETTYKNLQIQVEQNKISKEAAEEVEKTQTGLAKVYKETKAKYVSAKAENPGYFATEAVQKEAKRRLDAGLINETQYQKAMSHPWDDETAEGILAASRTEKAPSEYEDIIARMKTLDPKSTEYKQLEERRVQLSTHPSPITLLQSGDKGYQIEPQRGGQAPKIREFNLPGEGKGLLKIGSANPIQNPLGQDPDFWYEYYDKTKTLPPMAWGAAGNPTREAFLKGFPEWAKTHGKTGSDVGADIATFKANASALTSLTKDLNTFEPYKKMLDTNADIAIKLGQKIYQTNAALVNKSLNWLRQNASSNPDVAEYLAQMRFVQTEAARVINNPRIVGQLTDEARREMDSVIDGNAPIPVVERVLNRVKQDGTNRFNAMRSQQEEIVNKLKGGQPDVRPAQKSPTPQDIELPPAGLEGWHIEKDSQGHRAWVSPDRKNFREIE
jgi:hypothetical protein